MKVTNPDRISELESMFASVSDKATQADMAALHMGLLDRTSAMDYFTNQAARSGFGTPALSEGTQYELIRFSYNYWELITLYRNHWISRRIVDTPAKDMVRAWPKIISDIDPEEIKKINQVIRRTLTKSKILTTMQWGRLFGGAGALIIIDGHEDKLDEPLDLDDIPLGSFKGVIPFDRWSGINPASTVSTDFDRPTDFALPEYYTISAPNAESLFNVHASRVLRFIGPEVPTPEREAQTWWGISVLEPVYEEIKKRDNMSWNILNLTFRANLVGLTVPDLAELMSGIGQSMQARKKWSERMSQINHMMSNQSLLPIPADGALQGISYSFSGLSEVYQQFQLDIAGAAEVPVSRLFGRTISGLGQANDADERIYEEKISSDQEHLMAPQMDKLYPILCMSELGYVPDDLDLQYPSVRVLDEKEKAELAKTVTDTATVWVNSGFASPRRAAMEIKNSSDITGIGTALTDEFVQTLSDEVGLGGEMGMEMPGAEAPEGEEAGTEEGGEEPAVSLDPSSSPSHVLREERGERNHAEDALPFGQDAEFKEQEHPRDPDGKFATGSGGSSSASEGPKAKSYAAAKEVASGVKHAAHFFRLMAVKEAKGETDLTPEEIVAFANQHYGLKKELKSWKKHKAIALAMLNDDVVKAAPVTPEAVEKVVAPIAKERESPIVVHAVGTAGTKKVYAKLSFPPGTSNYVMQRAAMKMGMGQPTFSSFDPSKPSAPYLVEKDFTKPSAASELSAYAAQEAQNADIYVPKPEDESWQENAKFGATPIKPTTNASKLREPLTEGEDYAAYSYTNGSYEKINKALRNGTISSDQYESTQVKLLDMAIEKSALKQSTVLWRRAGFDQLKAMFGPKPRVGDANVDLGFFSTSKSSDKFLGRAVIMRVSVPKGAKALDTRNLKEGGANKSENEVILPRGSCFKLNGYRTNGVKHFLDLELVQQ